MADDRYGLPPPPAPPGPAPDPWSTGYPPTTAYPTSPYAPSPHATSPYAPNAPTQPNPAPRRRVPRWVVLVGAFTAVASVVSFVTVLLWPGGESPEEPSGPLAFQRFASISQLDFGPSNTVRTAMIGDRLYAGWEQGGAFHVKAVDVRDGSEQWQTAVTGASSWAGMSAMPGGVVVFADEDDTETPRTMYMRSAASGDPLWQLDVRADDRMFMVGDEVIGWLDREGNALHGLDPTTGGERWAVPFADDDTPSALSVTTAADLDQPTSISASTRAGSEDTRIALVHSDLSVQVIDGTDGEVISQGANLADPEADELLAYEGRLYVAPDEGAYRLVSYDLGDLRAQPQVHYTAADEDQYAEGLEACGAGRVCLLEQTTFDDASTEVVAVDTEASRELWREPVENAERLLPVGQWVAVAATVDFDDAVVVLDGAGNRALDSPGEAVRLNNSNLLVYEATLGDTESEIPVRGVAIDSGGLASNLELGTLAGVQGQNCSWNTQYVACPNRGGAEIWRFAEVAD